MQARDHLKIMRNAVVGLDEARRNADRRPKAHAMQLILDKWQQSVVGLRWHERPIRLEIDCRYEGPLTECCLESAAIDRIFYPLKTATGWNPDELWSFVQAKAHTLWLRAALCRRTRQIVGWSLGERSLQSASATCEQPSSRTIAAAPPATTSRMLKLACFHEERSVAAAKKQERLATWNVGLACYELG